MQFDFREFSPPDALRPFLRRSFYARGQIPYRYDKILPNGLAVVIFTIGGPHRLGPLETVDRNPLFDHSWFHGVQTRPVYNRPLGETHVLGLLFEPIGFHALFDIDMQRHVDQTVDARLVLPADVVANIEAALPDASDATTHASLHAALLNRQRTTQPTWLVGFYRSLVETEGAEPLPLLYERTGRSQRHASDRFRRAVGVTPKVLARIHRLSALLAAVDPQDPVPWTTLAHRLGIISKSNI